MCKAHYIRLGALTPNKVKPLDKMRRAAVKRCTRAVFSAKSSVNTRSLPPQKLWTALAKSFK